MTVRAAALAVAALAATSGFAGSAQAQRGGNLSFGVDTVGYTAPLPAGYCLPAGPQLESAQRAAALDKDNVTLLTLDSCGAHADAADYAIVKAPVALAGTEMRLRDVLRDPAFARPTPSEAPPETEKLMEDELSAKTGAPVDLVGGVGGMGHDDVCGYLGGTISAQSGASGTFSLGGCMTVVGGRVLTIFFYGRGGDAATIRRLQARARAFALSISVRKN